MYDATILALDVGTSGCRAEVFTLAGASLGRHHVEYGVHSPVPGAAEQSPEEWWQAVVTCTRHALRETDAAHCRAIGLSVQGHSWLPADAGLKPLRPALTWLDVRAAPQVNKLLRDRPAQSWGDCAGKQPGPWHLLPQLLWLRETEPETVRRAQHYLFAHDYLLDRLCGRVATDFTLAAGSLLFDLRQCQWSQELLDEYAVPANALPDVVPAGTLAGSLGQQAAAELGLSPKIAVAVGTQDQKAAALAAGLGDTTATASLGTATAIIARVKTPGFSPQHGAIPCFPYLQRGQWVLEAPVSTSGGALRWLRDLLGRGGQDGYAELIAAAAQAPPGAAGVHFFPYLAGAGAPHWRGDARGGFCGLSLHSGPGELTRALLEAVAYDLRANLEHMRAAGCDLQRLVLFGGGARSLLWPQIIASVCGLPTFAATDSEAASRGAAMLAASALGADSSAFALPAMPVEAPAGWQAAYEALYAQYCQTRERYWQL